MLMADDIRSGWSVNRRWKFELNSWAVTRICPLAITSRLGGRQERGATGDCEWGRSGADDMVSDSSQWV
jgi:hypothetical protein